MSDNDEKRQIFTSRMEKYHGKNAKNRKKSKLSASRKPEVQKTAPETKVPETPVVPEQKKELKFDLYERVSNRPSAPEVSEVKPAEPELFVQQTPSVKEYEPSPEPVVKGVSLEMQKEGPSVPEMPEEPDIADPEFPETSVSEGMSRFPKEEIEIPKQEEPSVKIEEDINKYRQNIAAVAFDGAAPLEEEPAVPAANETFDDITLDAKPAATAAAAAAAGLKAETAEEPEPVFEDDREDEEPAAEDKKAEKKRLKEEKKKEKAQKKAEKDKNRKISRTAKTWIIALIVIALVIAFLLLFVFEIVSVEGHSMEPTLNGGEKVIVDKVSRYFEYPERGQIVITKYDGYDGYYIKRVIAYPGEWVEVYDNTIYLNGEPLDEPYTSQGEISDMELTQVPEGCYFLVGDNRTQSLDSRQDTIGSVRQENLIGNAWAVIWPFDNIHLVK